MIAYFILGLVLLLCLYVLVRWFVEAKPKDVLRILKWFLVALVILFIGWLALTGKLALAFAVLPALFVWFGRFRTMFNIGKIARRMFGQQSGRSGASGQTSQVDTVVLRMTLDVDSGDMDGVVLEGPHMGRHLHDMSLDQLRDVLHHCRARDEESTRVMLAYLERHHPDDWAQDDSEDSDPKNRQSSASMTKEEALEILGLSHGASVAEIKVAYHRLIAQVHPDKGGSDYLAAKINQAKDILLP
jgi:DnaJ-like protein